MSLETIQQLINEYHRVNAVQEKDPHKEENMIFYVTKERDIYRLITEQLRQIIQKKTEETQILKNQLFRFEEQSKKLIGEAENQWNLENKKSSVYNEKSYVLKLQEEKEEKIASLEALIKEGKTVIEKQRKELLKIHDKAFAEINLKMNEIYASMPQNSYKREQSERYLQRNKIISEGIEMREKKMAKEIDATFIKFIKKDEITPKDSSSEHQITKQFKTLNKTTKESIIKEENESKRRGSTPINYCLDKSKQEKEKINNQITEYKPLNILTVEFPSLTSKIENYWGYFPLKEGFGTPQLFDINGKWIKCSGSNDKGTFLYPKEPWWDGYFKSETEEEISKWIGMDSNLRVVFLALKEFDSMPLEFNQYPKGDVGLLLRWSDGEIKDIIPRGYAFPNSNTCTKERATKLVKSYLKYAVQMYPITKKVETEMLQFEEVTTPKKISVGVVCSNGLTQWKEVTENRECDDKLFEFLGNIGNGIELLNFNGYNGGLDTTTTTVDGRYSVYSRKDCFEIMYHVVPLLTERSATKLFNQENIIIVFKEGEERIKLSNVQFRTQVIIVVNPLPSSNYRIEVWLRGSLKEVEMSLPKDDYIVSKKYLKEFMMSIIINASYTTSISGVLQSSCSRERSNALKAIYEKTLGNNKHNSSIF
ncbi:Rap/Ran GTPase-activating protein, putative [Entamoeba histolytica HM-1:IMSS-B]|uniref:Rap/Ran GTPase-activating protein, putative n=6 Tax=Entamoeba histolytica TaxID=5759 RepID=C4M0R9_ENTH1|nr:Rap/Ran GTPase-activating protein, putative [Entamoeba histolytica HM-1:IMSS]EMD45350.1 Rap/Ran GTPase-activating protein, putative [Entamoeba histolytica KU27]EMH77548.1 Rap/Ran GTPase-activating protein, putative [Entamoeba histolytica HM-1:IMSS-B]EMS14666.1 Rap/Ran GTPase-activating protein, putative [Entamoeba histolytica HM-3:IMSS]ENY61110.1 Rap/Ran GTPase-activating protein, putative [Entamoeba histolytica HM-1:IMSS-A]GAT94769.1 rap ran GTPase-activating protein putative [Entamoeba hi|eukprot:XP_657083.1 Rap/Ran GTPase-activating protein, putative [Entamoeba histolytica HM-1:IMSS]